MNEINILFLSANPARTKKLKLIEEVNSIDQKLIVTKERDHFRLEQRHNISVSDLQSIFQRFRPNIVHFSGHGSDEGTLIFQNSKGRWEDAPPIALASLFKILNRNGIIKCVILNACYSEPQAKAIAKHVDCVIGMDGGISDKAAIIFSESFYQALGYGNSVRDAFELGCNQLELLKIPQEHIPKLRHRKGVDPSKLFLLGRQDIKIKPKTGHDKRTKGIKKREAVKKKTSKIGPDLEIIWESGRPDVYEKVRPVFLHIPDRIMTAASLYRMHKLDRNTVQMLSGERYVSRKHLRVIVKNTGKEMAKSCYATIQLTKDGRLNGCESFSGEAKRLQWFSPKGVIETTVDIYPHGGEAILEVIFSDDFTNEFMAYSTITGNCHFEGSNASIRAYATTPVSYRNPWAGPDDGFCKGEFIIELTVFSANAKPVFKKYQLDISQDWNKISMREL